MCLCPCPCLALATCRRQRSTQTHLSTCLCLFPSPCPPTSFFMRHMCREWRGESACNFVSSFRLSSAQYQCKVLHWPKSLFSLLPLTSPPHSCLLCLTLWLSHQAGQAGSVSYDVLASAVKWPQDLGQAAFEAAPCLPLPACPGQPLAVRCLFI